MESTKIFPEEKSDIIIQATSRSPFSPKKIGLVDVDETLKIKIKVNGQSVYVIHQTMIDEMIKNGVKDVYLFTNMGFSDLNNVPILAEGQINYITRRQLVEYLRDQGINVLGVITQADVVYNKGLGAAYHLYEMAYDDCLEDSIKYQQNKNKLNSYQSQFDSYTVSHLDGYNEKFQAASQKKFMFQYFQEKIKDHGVEEIHYYEDDPTCIDAINKMKDERVIVHCVRKEELGPCCLVIPFQNDNQQVEINALIEKEQEMEGKKSIYHLTFKKLPPDSSSFRKSIQEALAFMIALYNYDYNLRKVFDENTMHCFHQSFYNFTLQLAEKINSMESNRAWIKLTTFVLAMLEHVNAKKYKEIKNITNCESILNLLEQIFTGFEKKLNLVANETRKELENKLATLSDEQKRTVQMHLFLENSIDDSFNEIKKLLDAQDKKSLSIWGNSKINIPEYEKAIIQMTKIIFECNNLIKENQLTVQKLKI